MVQQRPDAYERYQEWKDLIASGMSARKAAGQIDCPRETLYRYRAKFEPQLTTTKEVLDKNEQVVRTVKGLRQNTDVDTSGMRIKKVTETPYGGKYVSYENTPLDQEEVRKEFIESVRGHSPEYKEIKRTKIKDGHLLIIDIADLHVGKYSHPSETGEEYNIEIAVRRAKEGLKGILDYSAGFEVDKILLVLGNDWLHIDNPRRTTTSGTPQDTDGNWFQAFVAARKLFVEIIESLLPIADIHVVFNPSNHDYMSGTLLMDSIHSWFQSSKQITFDIDLKHRKYFKYGESLIGTSHGDGGKGKRNASLCEMMAKEEKDLWAKTTYRYWLLHHLHHYRSEERIGVTVEHLRSPSSADRWHSDNLFKSMPGVDAYVHSKDRGQVAKFTYFFKC